VQINAKQFILFILINYLQILTWYYLGIVVSGYVTVCPDMLSEFYLTTLHQQNARTCSLDIYIIISHLTFLHVPVPKGPSSGNQTK